MLQKKTGRFLYTSHQNKYSFALRREYAEIGGHEDVKQQTGSGLNAPADRSGGDYQEIREAVQGQRSFSERSDQRGGGGAAPARTGR